MTEPEGCDPGEKYLQAKYLSRQNRIRCFTLKTGSKGFIRTKKTSAIAEALSRLGC